MQCMEYIVKEGDTLYSIARKVGATVEELLEINAGISPERLVIGSVLCLPRGGAIIQNPGLDLPDGVKKPMDTNSQAIYVVKDGDTISSIAKAYGVSAEQLLFANPNVNPGYIVLGTKMNIPKADIPIPGSVKYTVKDDEDLLDILRKFGIGYGRLKLFNEDVDLTKLKNGMVIFVPELYGGSVGHCELGSYSYTVEPDDTASSIAEKFNLPESVIRKKGTLKPGMVICLPLTSFDDMM